MYTEHCENTLRNFMLHSKSPIFRRNAKRKIQYCQTVKWAKRVWNCIKIGKMSPFQVNPLNLFRLQPYSHLASETRTNLSALHWWMVKNPLESYWGDYLVTFKGSLNLSLLMKQSPVRHIRIISKVNKTPIWMHYVPSIQQDNAPCNSPLKYSCIHQGPGDIFEMPHYSVDLTSIDTDCSIVTRHVSRMSNIKDRHF